MTMTFQRAKRSQAKLRLAIAGPSGSGKTYGALLISKGLGGRVAVIDTEQNSSTLYDTLAEFDVLNLQPPYRPERFIEAIKSAEAAGYDVVIIDSISHEWNGAGGCLELNDEIAKTKYRGNTWSAWNETTPRHRAFVDTILASKCHIIATMRSKTETAQVEENGRKAVKKLGMKSEQREGAEYEFTTVLDLVHDGHYATASKDRSGMFGGDPQRITEETGRKLATWLAGAHPQVNLASTTAGALPVAVESPSHPVDDKPAQPDELKYMFAVAEGLGFAPQGLKQLIGEMYHISNSRDLTSGQVGNIIRTIKEIGGHN